jgi:hypothetical protein
VYLIALAGLLAVALGRAGSAASQPGLLVGITDSRFLTAPGWTMADTRDLGLGAVHVFLTWHPGQVALSGSDAGSLDAITAAGGNVRIVVTVVGRARDAPLAKDARAAYCADAGDLVSRYPAIRDVVIWNEPNVDYFWQPQFNADGSSAAPAAYEALLAQCYDVLHAARPDVNVIMSTSPGGNDNPAATSNVSHSAGAFVEKVGLAYRQSGRTRPIFDTIAHSAYGLSSAEPPWQQHLGPGLIGEGDLDHLVESLDRGFGGTAQHVPGDCAGSSNCPTIWYLEVGWQTIPDGAHDRTYTGVENDAHSVPDQPVAGDPAAATQASQLTAGVELAYCQPYVGAFFNFLLEDEPDLEGWQSGVLWANGDQKASFAALKQAAAQAASRKIDCAQFQASTRTSIAAVARSALVDRVQWPALPAYSAFNTVWSFAVDSRIAATYRAALAPVGKQHARTLTAAGTLKAGRPRTVTFAAVPVPAGKYRITLVIASAGAPHKKQTLVSPAFAVS